MKKIIVIGGPTASGKTALAIRCALRMGTEIISADSRQCYTEMTIGTAKPSADELISVPHHFIDSHHLPLKVNAGIFSEYATPVLENLLRTKGSAVIAGGTGLYIRALLEGLDDFPPVPESIRSQLKLEAASDKALYLHQQELREKDPVWFDKIDTANHRRILRALEVIRTTTLPYSSFLSGKKRSWDADIRFFYPDPERAVLYNRIEERVRKMVASGLEEEVRSLIEWEKHPALHTVGYQEFFPYFTGRQDLQETIQLIIQHTRNYAKRQWTWFRNQGIWTPVDPESNSFQTGQLTD